MVEHGDHEEQRLIPILPKPIIKKILEYLSKTFIASCSYDNSVKVLFLQFSSLFFGTLIKKKIWDIEERKCVQSWIGHNGIVRAIYNVDNKILVTGSYDNLIKVNLVLFFFSHTFQPLQYPYIFPELKVVGSQEAQGTEEFQRAHTSRRDLHGDLQCARERCLLLREAQEPLLQRVQGQESGGL